MKKRLFFTPGWHLIRYCLLASSIIYFINGCQGCRPEKITERSNSINISLKGNLTDAIETGIRKKFSEIGIESIIIKRCPCDPSLINIALPNDVIFEGHEGEMAVKPTAGGSGGDIDLRDFGTVVVNIQLSSFDTGVFGDSIPNSLISTKERRDTASYNDVPIPAIKLSQSVKDQLDKAVSSGKNSSKAVTIAFLDSGFDPSFLTSDAWKTSTTLCETNSPPSASDQGWNFLTNPVSTNTFDDQDIQHGSRVALLAAQQFAQSDVPLKIAPMKVLNKENKGDLFSILCALETARKNKVDIINMSLGYYGAQNALFKEYLKRSTDDNIWIIVAAGNEKDKAHERNLSAMKSDSMFYPAMFSKTNERVFAVTTVSNGQLCERQNFDPTRVVGVKEDAQCHFRLFRDNNKYLIFGTSYATPMMAGWLGRSIRDEKLKDGSPQQQRQEVLSRMTDSGIQGLEQKKIAPLK